MRFIVFPLFLLSLFACKNESSKPVDLEKKLPTKKLAKFEPADGKCLLFVGQEMTAIGGLAEFNDGYLDHFKTPAGFTMYTKIRPGDEEFGFTYQNIPSGIFTTDDWGDSPSNMSLQVADEDFKNMALAIGFEMVNHEEKIANGSHDSIVMVLGDWIKSLGDRPVFLRIGYEFGGSWNHYDRENYIKAYRRMKDMYDAAGITNIAYVWQSHGWDEPLDYLESWYPGDTYVDWCSYSFFSRFDESNMIKFARKKGKPVFIAEATPTINGPTTKTNGKTKETILSNPTQAAEAWEKWFIPFFNTIEKNEDVVKAISYINCHWKGNRMWVDNPTFQDVDARLQINTDIAKKWKDKVYTDRYIHASDNLFEELTNKNKQ